MIAPAIDANRATGCESQIARNGLVPGNGGEFDMTTPAKRLLYAVLTALVLASSTGPAFSQSSCTTGDRWSLAHAREWLGEAARLGNELGDSDCRYDNYPFCQRIMAAVSQAHDNIYQVFDQNYDNGNRCKKCGFDEATAAASVILAWEKWLHARYFGEASGIGNIHLTIQQYADVPMCAANGNAGMAGGPGIEVGVDRPGKDYRNFDIANDPAICQKTCESDSSCRAWTFVKPGLQGSSARCWLKSAVPGPVSDSCCASGVVQRSGNSANQCPTTYANTFSKSPDTAIRGANTVSGSWNPDDPDACRRKCLALDWCVSFEEDKNYFTCNYQDSHPCNSKVQSTPGVDLYSRNGLN